MSGNFPKRRRVIIEDEEDDQGFSIFSNFSNFSNSFGMIIFGLQDGENDSNPDKDIDDDRAPSDEEEGEDLMENWMA